MELDTIIINTFFTKICLTFIFLLINKKISYLIFINIISTFIFFIFTSLGDIHFIKYILSEVFGLILTIFVYIFKKDQEHNQEQRNNNQEQRNNNQVVTPTHNKYIIVIQPDGGYILGIFL